MKGNQKSSRRIDLIDLFSLPFTVFPLNYFRNGGQLLYYLKFFGLFLVVWAPGILVTHLSGSFFLYMNDWGHLLVLAMYCAGLLLLVNLCQQTAATIDELDRVTNHTKDKRFLDFIKKWNSSSFIWYSLCILTPVAVNLCSTCFNLLGLHHLHGPPPTWTDFEAGYVTLETARFNSIYSVYETLLSNLILGIGFNRFVHYLLLVDDYGKQFLSKTSIDLLHPGAIEELKPFQRLAIKSTFFCSLPLTMSSLLFFEHLIRKQSFSRYWLGGIILCIFLFFFTLLSQMKWVRRVLLEAKMEALAIIDESIDKVRIAITEDATTFLTLANLFTFRDKLKKTHVWALDTELISKFFLAIFLPIIGGAIIQIILEHLLIPLFS